MTDLAERFLYVFGSKKEQHYCEQQVPQLFGLLIKCMVRD